MASFFFFRSFHVVAALACAGALAASCGHSTASDAGSTSGNMGGGGAAPDACAGLGCPACDGDVGNTELCFARGETCKTSADCPATISAPCAAGADPTCHATATGNCSENLGTYTEDLLAPSCLSGQCVYHVVSAGCADLTSCGDCSKQGKDQDCAFKDGAGACASCCEVYYSAKDYAHLFEACACDTGKPCASACTGSPLCGGKGPETDACAACVATTLREGGACLDDAAFQKKCIGNADGSVFCQKMSECLATCENP